MTGDKAGTVSREKLLAMDVDSVRVIYGMTSFTECDTFLTGALPAELFLAAITSPKETSMVEWKVEAGRMTRKGYLCQPQYVLINGSLVVDMYGCGGPAISIEFYDTKPCNKSGT